MHAGTPQKPSSPISKPFTDLILIRSSGETTKRGNEVHGEVTGSRFSVSGYRLQVTGYRFPVLGSRF
jgi:hypothetical protein